MPIALNRQLRHRPDLQHGVTLLEVLVSLLIFSFGILGMAALQSEGIAANLSAFHMTQAVTSANDMADRMRANRAALSAGFYDAINSSRQDACYTAAGCSPAQMAANDLYEWSMTLATELPGGTGITCRDSSPQDGTPTAPGCTGSGAMYAIKIWWDDNRDGVPEQQIVLELLPE